MLGKSAVEFLSKTKHHLSKGIRILTLSLGCFSLFLLVLSFTDVPYYAYHALGMTNIQDGKNLKHIVIMGGDGMPSPSGLIRAYYGARLANENPDATVYLALPYNEEEQSNQLDLFAKELMLKGVAKERIVFEPHGFNTYSQAVNLSKLIAQKSEKTCIVSSPEHIFRTIHCFKKQGFENVTSMPTFEVPSDEEKLKDLSKPNEKKVRNLSLRYNMWSYLGYEIKVLREYTAISYYWLKDWI